MFLALACALTATVSYGVGTVLQAAGARRVATAEHLDVMLLARLARESLYIGGLALDAVGFVARRSSRCTRCRCSWCRPRSPAAWA